MNSERPEVSAHSRTSRTFAAVMGGYALLGGLITLVGWIWEVPRLTDWAGTGIAMFANTAIVGLLAGAAILIGCFFPRASTFWCRLFGTIVSLFGGLTLFEHLSGINLGIDSLLVVHRWGLSGATSQGRMGPPASTSYFLLGIAIVCSASGRSARRIVPVLGIVVCSIAMLSIMGYIFGASALYSVARFTGIAWQTATIVLALGIGILFSVPEQRPISLLRDKGSAGLLARRALPMVVGLPILLAWIRTVGEKAGLYDSGMGRALLVLSLVGVFCALLWWSVVAIQGREAELRRSENLFRTLVQATSQTVWQYRPDWQYLPHGEPILGGDDKTSAWWREFTGQSEEERSAEGGLGWLAAVHEDDRAEAKRSWEAIVATDQPTIAEYRVRRRDGEWRWMRMEGAPIKDESGVVLEWAGTITDCTVQRQAQEALRENEERLRLATQTGKVGVWDWDITNNRLLWTDSLYSMHGVTKDEFLGDVDAFSRLVHPNDRERVAKAIELTLKGGSPYELEFRVVKPDGGNAWFFTNAVVLREGDKPVRMLGATVDITDRKLAEQQLADRTVEIEALNERLRRAMSETHHRVKNNLQVVIALIEIQSIRYRDLVPVEELTRMSMHVRSLAAIHDLLTLGTKDPEGKNLLGTRDVADRLAPLLQSVVGDRAVRFSVLDMALTSRHCIAIAILVNELVSNAVKHGAGDIDVTLAEVNNQIRLEICDRGPGFSREFDVRTSANTGLQLIESVSKWDLQGTAIYENRKGGGARVIIELPRPKAESENSAKSNPDASDQIQDQFPISSQG